MTRPPHILVIDDDPKVLSLMRRGLAYAGYSTGLAADGEQGLAQAREQPPDVVVLDVMLPGLDGVEVCKRLRSVDPSLPVLMLTAKGRLADRIAGLDAGADDYLVKPFAFDELLARIRALLRRTWAEDDPILEFADVTVNPATREVTRGNRPISLTAKEYDLLEFFLRHPRQVLTRAQIVEQVWGADFPGESNVVDVHVLRLRDRLEAAGEPRLIHTFRGAGYSLRDG